MLPVRSGESGETLHWTRGRKWIVEQDSRLSLSVVDTDTHTRICRNTHATKVLGYHLWVLNQLAGAQLASSSDKMPNMLPNGLDQMNEICCEVFLFLISVFFFTLVNFFLFLSLSLNSPQIASTFLLFLFFWKAAIPCLLIEIRPQSTPTPAPLLLFLELLLFRILGNLYYLEQTPPDTETGRETEPQFK